MKQRKLAPGVINNKVAQASNEQVFLKYCKTEDIGRQQQVKLIYKASFLAKIQHLKMKG